MQRIVKPVDRDRLSVLVAVLLLGGVLFRFIELPEHVWQLRPLGSPLEIHLTGVWLLIALMVAVVCTGTNLILHGHPHLGEFPGRPIYIFWILPGVLAGLAAYLLAWAAAWPLWVVVLILTGVSVGVVIAAEYTTVCPDTPGYAVARFALNVVAYVLAFVLFAAIYHARARSLVTATLALGVAALLSLDLLSVTDAPLRRVLIFSGVVGLVVGESVWALNYWSLNAWIGGMFLLLIFYVAVNIALQHLLGRLRFSILIEFAFFTVVVLAFILLKSP